MLSQRSTVMKMDDNAWPKADREYVLLQS